MTLFFVFAIINILQSRSNRQIGKLGINSIAPENLQTAPESFRLKLRVESRDFPVDEMTKTKAWTELQDELTGYSERLKLMDKQNDKRSDWIISFYMISAIGMVACTYLNKRNKRRLNGDWKTSV